MVQQDTANDQVKPGQPPPEVPGAVDVGPPPVRSRRYGMVFTLSLIGVSIAPSVWGIAGIFSGVHLFFYEVFSLKMTGLHSLVLAIALSSPYFTIPGVIFSLMACCMGWSNLRAMRAGRMSCEGRNNTTLGLIFGILGMPLNGFYYVVFWFLSHFAP